MRSKHPCKNDVPGDDQDQLPTISTSNMSFSGGDLLPTCILFKLPSSSSTFIILKLRLAGSNDAHVSDATLVLFSCILWSKPGSCGYYGYLGM